MGLWPLSLLWGGCKEIEQSLLLLHRKVDEIMSKLDDYILAQQDVNKRISSSVEGLVGDVAELNRQIAELQANSVGMTPEQETALADLAVAGEGIAGKLGALDQVTPPVAPPVEP